MEVGLFSTFAPTLRDMTEAELVAEIDRPQLLLLASGTAGGRKVEIAYAPFDHVNRDAEVVIVGLTPGRQQMRNALAEARRNLRASKSEADAMKAAKVFASFSGPMRANLVAMLDCVGVPNVLRIASTASLWSSDAHRVHFTSALRYPVFVDDTNFSGAPSMISTPLLRDHLTRWFAAEMAALPRAVFVPLGPKVTEAVEFVARQVGLDQNRVLAGLPHPSGANAERIAFFLGRKPREELSNKVDPEKLIEARASFTLGGAAAECRSGGRAVASTDLNRNVHIGTAGWSIPRAHAARFPSAGSHLERYAARFDAVEINSSFYKPHRPATYARWAASVPDRFRFAVKVPREITHTRRLADAMDPLDRFLSEAAALGTKLGPLLVQLPPSLPFRGDVAGRFFGGVRDRFGGHVACEPRHRSWFTDSANDTLLEFRVARVAADPARVPSAAEPGGWPGLAYYRLHGSPRMYYSAYAPDYLAGIAKKLVVHATEAEVWCIFDNTALGAATDDALAAAELLNLTGPERGAARER